MTRVNTQALLAHAMELFSRKDHRPAADLCRQVLKAESGNLNALSMLAEIARLSERTDEELAYLTKAVRLAPKNAALRERLGHHFRMTGAEAKAILQYEKALKLEPGRLTSIAGLAEVYDVQHRPEKARTLIERHLADPPNSAALYPVLIRVFVNAGETDAAIEHGERLLAAGRPEQELGDTCFQLARAYERAGDYDRAFRTARRANEILAPPFDPDAFVAGVDRIVETFTRDRLASIPRPSSPSDLPVFIVGTPRCGSTLVERIVDSHPAAYGAGELRLMPAIVRDIALRLSSTRPYPACVEDFTVGTADELSGEYLDALKKLAPKAARICDKDLGNHHRLGLIEILFPRGRVVHCRRDPIDTCLSCYMLPFDPVAIPFASDLGHLAIFYRQYVRLMTHWHEVLDLPILDVEYETLVADQENESRRLIDFCGLPWNDACLRFHEKAGSARTQSYDQVRKPIYRSSVKRADRFGAHLDPLRAALAE